MSKKHVTFLSLAAAGIQVLALCAAAMGQDVTATITIDAASPSVVKVDGRWARAADATAQPARLSFMLEYAGITGLGERIKDVRLSDRKGGTVGHRRIMGGEYIAEAPFVAWSYSIDLTPQKTQSAAAHTSWVGRDGGIVMLDDLLPQIKGGGASAEIGFIVPTSWAVVTTAGRLRPGVYSVGNTERSIFYLGPGATDNADAPQPSSGVRLYMTGKWLFSWQEAQAMADSVYRGYEAILGPLPAGDVLVGLANYPNPVGMGNWEAETRGTTVTIVSSDMPFRSQSLQRLHEQLRHEILHLWIPNAVNLSGSYDWFYEGFALYQSLKTGVATNQIGFADMLDTLSRAYDIDRRQTNKLSLIDESKHRWSGSKNNIYARGMIVAFLCDLAMLQASKGKRSIADLLLKVYTTHRPPAAMRDSNTAVLALLRSHAELVPLIDRYITGAAPIDWQLLLQAAGLGADSSPHRTKLVVTARPTGRQKDLLNKLGYNSWRKAPQIHR